MNTQTFRQYRGLILAWRRRPQYLHQPQPTATTPPLHVQDVYTTADNTRYQRFALPSFGPISGKGAYKLLAGRCRWCRQPVAETGRRVWHADCLPAYWAATGNQSALVEHLTKQYREEHGNLGTACAACNLSSTVYWNYITDRFPEHESYLWFHKLGIDWTITPRQTSNCTLELDHHDALSVAWASGSEHRLIRALTLDNLRWLCHECHATKTGQDRHRMKNLLEGRPEHSTPPPSKRARIQQLQLMLPILPPADEPST